MSADDSSTPRPPLQLVHGDASPEELAALIAVLSAASAAEPPAAPRKPVSRWAAREHGVRGTQPSGWRASALPG